MKNRKQLSSLALATALSLSLLTPAASAAEPAIVYQGENYYITRRPVEKMYDVFPAWVGEHRTAFKEGLALVYEREMVKTSWGVGEKNHYRFIDRTGETVIHAEEYDSVNAFSEGLAAVSKDGKWGYIDKTGTLVIPCIYEFACDFSEGLADVTLNGKEGFIDKSGNVVFPIEYDWVESFSDGLAKVTYDNRETAFIDKTGKVIIPPDYMKRYTVPSEATGTIPAFRIDSFSEGLSAVNYFNEDLQAWCRGYADKTGEVVLALPYQILTTWAGYGRAANGSHASFSEGMAAVSFYGAPGYSGNLGMGYIDKTGREVIPLTKEFSIITNFSDGMAAVRENTSGSEYWAFIDRNGTKITPYQYQYSDPVFDAYFSDGLASFTYDKFENGIWVNHLRNRGYIDKTGRTVLDGYMTVYGFNGGLAMAEELTDHGDQWYILEKVSTVPTAYAATQSVLVDGTPVELQAYALKDEAGNATNYVRLRDVAQTLTGTAAQFEVGYNGAITITTGLAYTPNGSEKNTPFYGNCPYQESSSPLKIDGVQAALSAIVLTDDTGGGYTYFKLRDLGEVLGFNVDWSAEQGVFIETDKPYSK